MWIERVQRASAQFEKLNSRLGPALDPKLCVCLPVEPAVFHIFFPAHGKKFSLSPIGKKYPDVTFLGAMWDCAVATSFSARERG